MLSALSKGGCLSVAVELLEKWKSRVAITGQTYKVLLTGLEEATGKPGAELLRALRNAGLKMKTLIYNSMIEIEAKQNKAAGIEEIFLLMQEDGCVPDTFTTALQIKALCNAGNIKAAFRAFEAASAASGKVDTVAYNTLLDGCIRMSEQQLADKLLDMIDTSGIEPTNFTLGTVIKLHGKRQELQKCFEVCDQFKRKYGVNIDITIKNCLMSACILNNNVDVTIKLFQQMLSDHETLEIRTILSILGLCRRKNRLDEALNVCKEIVEVNVRGLGSVDPHELNALFIAFDKVGRSSELVPIYRRLVAQNINLAQWLVRRL
jgi:pentatricopeptide repeat protein